MDKNWGKWLFIHKNGHLFLIIWCQQGGFLVDYNKLLINTILRALREKSVYSYSKTY